MAKKAGKIALGLGLLTGAVTGLLFAPEEGKKIRKKIAQGDTKGLFNDILSMGEEIKEMVVDLSKKPSVMEALDKAKDKAADVANMKREELDAMLRKANKKAEGFKKAVAKYVKEQKAVLDERWGEKKKKKSRKSAKPTVQKKTPVTKTLKKSVKKSVKKKKKS